MEVITNILIPNGWADARISTQASLLPSLRKAAQATAVTRQEQKRSTPYLVPLQLQVRQTCTTFPCRILLTSHLQ